MATISPPTRLENSRSPSDLFDFAFSNAVSPRHTRCRGGVAGPDLTTGFIELRGLISVELLNVALRALKLRDGSHGLIRMSRFDRDAVDPACGKIEEHDSIRLTMHASVSRALTDDCVCRDSVPKCSRLTHKLSLLSIESHVGDLGLPTGDAVNILGECAKR